MVYVILEVLYDTWSFYQGLDQHVVCILTSVFCVLPVQQTDSKHLTGDYIRSMRLMMVKALIVPFECEMPFECESEDMCKHIILNSLLVL